MTARRASRLAFGLIVTAAGIAAPAAAQVSGGLAVVSDYRFRGVSLSDRRPAVSLSAAYDHPSGLYAGGSLIADDPARAGPRMLGHTEYLGLAGRKSGGLSWDIGVNKVDLSLYLDRKYRFSYTQAYVGLSRDRLSARLYLAPNYPQHGVSTAYIDLAGGLRPAENWRLSGHVGAQVRLDGPERRYGRRDRYDVRLGLARKFGPAELSLSWVAAFPRLRPKTSVDGAGVVAGANWFF